MSIALAGAALASFIGGPISDKLGRKTVILISDVAFTIGAILMAFAATIPALAIGRFFVGVM